MIQQLPSKPDRPPLPPPVNGKGWETYCKQTADRIAGRDRPFDWAKAGVFR